MIYTGLVLSILKVVAPKGINLFNFLTCTDDDVNEYTLPAAYNLTTPTLSFLQSPADNATGVSVDANIVLNFSEKVGCW